MFRLGNRRRRIAAAFARVAVVGAMLVTAACETAPGRAWQAGQLYVSGTEALERGDHARAIDALEEAARLAPEASEVRNHLGLAYQGAGRPERARAAFESALALDCDNEAARINLARLDAKAALAADAHDGR